MQAISPGLEVVPLRTPTLPPATHTNTYLVGTGDITVIDPASPYEDEQNVLLNRLDERRKEGERVARIVLTHHHEDHIGGAVALRNALHKRGEPAPICCHPITAALIADTVKTDIQLEADQQLLWGGRRIRSHLTPGHAPGHLVFHDMESGATIAGDMVAGIGTILISPTDGNLGEYLHSLQRMRALDSTVLLPAHGPPLTQPEAVLSMYIAHRHMRTDQIRQALDTRGASTPFDLVADVYPTLPTTAHGIASVQILSHLLWMQEHGLAMAQTENRWVSTRISI